MKIAIVADWLTNQGGAEKVIYDIHQTFPEAPIYTSVYNAEKLPQFNKAEIKTSFIQNLPFSKKHHQLYLGLMPYAFESFDFSDYDIVISSSFACAKGILTKPETLHICYCHNPMRYIWDESHQYVREHNLNPILKFLSTPFLHRIRQLDQLTANRVDHYISNSNFVARRINKYYHHKATTVYPATDFNNIKPNIKTNKKDFYLAAGRLKPFKRFDLIIEAFNITQKKLIIAGTGEDLPRLQKLNTNPNTTFAGFVSDQKLIDLYQNAKGFIFPQAEDFGITPIEAQFHGCPIIAYAKGGALETVIEKETGLFFKEQSTESLNQAINKFEKQSFDYQKVHLNGSKYNSQNFKKELLNLVENWDKTRK
jgi:glycosyltransferase involved in cell wall biosynthesis